MSVKHKTVNKSSSFYLKRYTEQIVSSFTCRKFAHSQALTATAQITCRSVMLYNNNLRKQHIISKHSDFFTLCCLAVEPPRRKLFSGCCLIRVSHLIGVETGNKLKHFK